MNSGAFKSMMRLVQKQNLLTTLRYRFVFFFLGTGTLISLVVFFNFTNVKKVKAATETLSSGSFIINMGVTPQTYANGLKPYGMLFDLIINYSVPIKWVIEPTKLKDSADFTYNAVKYKGGPFIIPAEYINSTISNRITYWQTQGVQGVYTTASISVPVYTTLTAFSISIIDNQAGREGIIQDYFTNAAIPSAGYVVGTPSVLQDCNDIWINPHGDPTWASHGYLYNYVTVSKCFIWVECHAVSVMEGIQNSVAPFQRLNYLTTNGLKCYSNGKCVSATETHGGNPTSPFTHYYPADPVMQFMGTMDGACNGGSEKWYQPQVVGSGAWRATTKRLVTTSDGASPNEGILMAYGPGFGDPSNGYVMYEAGHDLGGNGTTAEKVAAQRAFFNFVLLAGITKKLTFSSYTIPNSFKANETKAVSATISSGTPPYSYSWSTSVGGTFTNGTLASASFTAPNTPTPLNGALKCTVIDACGRQNFVSQIIAVSENTLPITLKSFSAKKENKNVVVQWTTGSEINNDYFTIERSNNGYDFIEIGKVDGSGNSSVDVSYSFTDKAPFSGDNYYRLIQTNFDGKYKIYLPVHVKNNNREETTNNIIGISPNPFSGFFKIDYSVQEAGEIEIILFNREGKGERSIKIDAQEGFSSYIFNDISTLSPGVYYIMLKPASGSPIISKVVNY